MKYREDKVRKVGVPKCCIEATKLVERTERSIEASKNCTKLVGQSKPRF